MSDLVIALLIFFASAAVVVASGSVLAKYGDEIADRKGWGQLWVGTMLLAAATSMPELIANITAAWRDQPGLAVGNIFGANMVNMFFMAAIALAFGIGRFFGTLAPQHKLLAGVALSTTALTVVLGASGLDLSIFKVGLASVIILAAYLAGVRLLYVNRPLETAYSDNQEYDRPIAWAWAFLGAAALCILVSAPALTYSVEQIAEETGLATSFLGVLAVAVVTALPETATTVAATRMGAPDLAVGNIYGSCAFNLAALAVADPFYRGGVLVASGGQEHVAAGVAAVGLMAAGTVLIFTRGTHHILRAKPIAAVMILGYIGAIVLVFRLS